MPTLRLRDGHTLHYTSFGRGPTVVLLHGFAMNGGLWLHSVLPLARRYRFVLPDLRGCGRSHAVPYAHRDIVRNHAEDVAELLAHLGGPVRLGGLSMGALTGLALAEAGGFANVRAYVHIDQGPRIHNDATYSHGLFGPAQRDRFPSLRRLLTALEPLRGRPFEALPRALTDHLHDEFSVFYRTAFQLRWLKATAAHAMARPRLARRIVPFRNWETYADCLRAYLDERYDFTDVLSDTRVPVTVMVGEASEMYPAEGQLAFAARIPRARVVRFPRVGHAVPYEAPVSFVRELARALDAVD